MTEGYAKMHFLHLPVLALALAGFAARALAADATVPAVTTAPTDPSGVEFFETKIRPLLADHCYKCHSADAAKAKKLKGGLFLDTKDGLLKGGENGPAIVPGRPANSRLITAVRWADEDLKMPPKERLPESAVADLEKWVAMGAPDPRAGAAPPTTTAAGVDIEAGRKFWAFRPLAPVAVPAAKHEPWARTAIDRFILARLEAKGLAPNPPASKTALVRRACFDLTGLPPTPEAVDAFVNDPSADAWEKVIDRLLASPAHGERWARHWLDVARFAESDGYEFDSDRPAAWPYRDFVIRALNDDMPFDRFARWQIAGDELAPDDAQAMAATGFLSAGVFPTQITEREFESTRYDQLDDMVSTTGVAFLGLTVGCARCHDHKFDPVGTQDYYRLAASFCTAVPCEVEVDKSTPAERDRLRREWESRVANARETVQAMERGAVASRFDAFVSSIRKDPSALRSSWSVLRVDDVKTAHGTNLALQPDGSLLKTGKTPVKELYTLTAHTTEQRLTALRLEALADKSLPHDGPGAGDNGNFALSEIEVSAAPADGSAKPAPVKIASASATFQQNDSSLSVASSFDGQANTGWAVDGGGIGKSQAAIFRFEKPIGFPGGTVLTVVLRFEHPSPRHLIGRARLSVTTIPDANDFAGPEGPGPAIAQTLASMAAREAVPPAKSALARDWFASTVPEYARLKQELARLELAGPEKSLVRIEVTCEGLTPIKSAADGRGYPHFYSQVSLLRRGDPNNKIEPVTQSFPRVLMRGGKLESYWQTTPPAGARTSLRRTALANWLTDPRYGAGHLAARVIVNRVWQHHFGRGIVATPNDFGAQGDRPTHPELLDWLADDLIEHGWTLKRLHKQIMTSAAYMESAQTSPDRLSADPHDQLFWRWEPRRLEAEPIRDSLLAVSGLLDPTMFGPGTLDESMRRRSIYFTVKRSRLIPMLMVLDWPEPLNSIGARPTTTVAPQALLLLNSPQARLYAEAFAGRVKSAAVPDSIERGYRQALDRDPTPAEAAAAVSFIQHQAQGYREANRSDPEKDALIDFCQALLSANEFIYVE